MTSFHVYPSGAGKHYNAYDHSQPLACDTAEFDFTGAFDFVNHCFVAPCDCVVKFYAQILWDKPISGAAVTLLFMKNVLGTAAGGVGGENSGIDDIVYQSVVPLVKSVQNSRIMSLLAGDKVWAVPVVGASGGASLTGAATGSPPVNTCNYFEGEIIS